jgi:hypothetical protein
MKKLLIVSILVLIMLFVGCGKDDNGTGPGDNPPQAVELTVTDSTGSSISLAWTKNTESDFASYKVYRALSAGVGTGSNNLTAITNQSDTTYTDSNLSPHHTYYYKVYVFDTDNLSSGSNEVQTSTSGLTGLTIRIDPRELTVSSGSSFSLAVWIDAVTELFGASFELYYDGTKITADSASMGDFLGSDVIFFDHYTTDTVSIAVTRKAGVGGVSGYGTLAIIWFQAIGTGTTAVNFASDLALNKEDGAPVEDFSSLDKWSASIEVE